MRILILVNEALGIGAKQTTLRLIDVALKQDHSVVVLGVADLGQSTEGVVWGLGRELSGVSHENDPALVARIAATAPARIALASADAMLIRTNPGRDPERRSLHFAALQLCRVAGRQGLRVLNDPSALQSAFSKLYLLELPPETRPQTLVGSDSEQLIEFIASLDGPAVIKPINGSRGNDVFCVESAKDKNLRQILEVVLRSGHAMVQNFVPEAVRGDTRVLLVDGEILRVNGHPAAFRRIPSGSEFRSNLDQGGTTAQAAIDEGIERSVQRIGPVLRRDGLFFVGLDFLGDKVCEVNAFSPGGVRAAYRYERVDFTSELLRLLVQRWTTT
ncbi:MAG TPA: hypothetical protein DEA08_02515 [Planctomycetes bacterium]|nr:hypothetical protein [Planctomycetota bacterium]